MKTIRICPLSKAIHIRYTGEMVTLPPDIRQKIDAHWQELILNNEHLFNGEAFTVISTVETPDAVSITLDQTDYAHYLYSHQVRDLGEYAVRIIHSATLVYVADGKIIFGSMGPHTSRPNVIQCSGGGLDNDDITDDVVDIEHNTAKELREELGIDVSDSAQVTEFAPTYLKEGGFADTITVVFTVHLKATSQEFLQNYDKFAHQLRGQGEEPEFGELFCLNPDRKTIQDFVAKHQNRFDEYMPILLQTIAK
jgi:8-oxo-dGTP pyrophosphatase MutT (NUDIX family)